MAWINSPNVYRNTYQGLAGMNPVDMRTQIQQQQEEFQLLLQQKDDELIALQQQREHDITRLTQRCAELENENSALLEELNGKTSDVSKHRTKHEEYEEQLAQCREQCWEHYEACEALRERLAEVEGELSVKTSECESLQALLQEQLQSYRNTQEFLRKHIERTTTLQTQLETTTAENEALRIELIHSESETRAYAHDVSRQLETFRNKLLLQEKTYAELEQKYNAGNEERQYVNSVHSAEMEGLRRDYMQAVKASGALGEALEDMKGKKNALESLVMSCPRCHKAYLQGQTVHPPDVAKEEENTQEALKKLQKEYEKVLLMLAMVELQNERSKQNAK